MQEKKEDSDNCGSEGSRSLKLLEVSPNHTSGSMVYDIDALQTGLDPWTEHNKCWLASHFTPPIHLWHLSLSLTDCTIQERLAIPLRWPTRRDVAQLENVLSTHQEYAQQAWHN